jgi:uncharacterized protein YegL
MEDLAEKPKARGLIFFFIADVSSSMHEKIKELNEVMGQIIRYLREAKRQYEGLEFMVSVLEVASSSFWMDKGLTPLNEFHLSEMISIGKSQMGTAFDLLNKELSKPVPEESAMEYTYILLLTDGNPTDDYKPSLDNLLKNQWFLKSFRQSISYNKGPDMEMLKRFAGGIEHVTIMEGPDAFSNMAFINVVHEVYDLAKELFRRI